MCVQIHYVYRSDWLCVHLWSVWIKRKGGGVEGSRVKLVENKLILSQIYFTLLISLSPQSKRTINVFMPMCVGSYCVSIGRARGSRGAIVYDYDDALMGVVCMLRCKTRWREYRRCWGISSIIYLFLFFFFFNLF